MDYKMHNSKQLGIYPDICDKLSSWIDNDLFILHIADDLAPCITGVAAIHMHFWRACPLTYLSPTIHAARPGEFIIKTFESYLNSWNQYSVKMQKNGSDTLDLMSKYNSSKVLDIIKHLVYIPARHVVMKICVLQKLSRA